VEHEGSRTDPVLGVSEVGNAVVVRLAGELDLYNAPAVREALAEAGGRGPARVAVDLSEVTFVDSLALGTFVEAHAKLGRGHFALAAPGVETRRALEVSGLHRHLAVYDSVQSALDAAELR
jgi:anti-sigma B factor antagonist